MSACATDVDSSCFHSEITCTASRYILTLEHPIVAISRQVRYLAAWMHSTWSTSHERVCVKLLIIQQASHRPPADRLVHGIEQRRGAAVH